jgi:SPP1 gp7 family putative phage head morphogenesis protein
MPSFAQQPRARRELLAHLKSNRPRRTKRVPRSVYPRNVELSYQLKLRPLVRYVAELTQRQLLPLLPGLAKEAAVLRGDALRFDDANDIKRRLAIIRIEAHGVFTDPKVTEIARSIGAQTEEASKANLQRQLESAIGIKMPLADPRYQARLEAWTGENVKLITDLPDQTLNEIEKGLLSGLNAGMRAEEMADLIQQRFNVTESRAALIAADQVGKFYSATQKAMQSDVGLTHFYWQTQGDERVRPEHAELNGKRFSWKLGAPIEGFPGEPVRCRCTPEPDVDGLLNQLLDS